MQSCKGLELPLAAEPHQMLQVLLLPTNALYIPARKSPLKFPLDFVVQMNFFTGPLIDQ